MSCVTPGEMLSLSHSVPGFVYMKMKNMITPNFYDYVNSKYVKSRVRESSAFSVPHYSQGNFLKTRSGGSQRSCLPVEKQVFLRCKCQKRLVGAYSTEF